jgi:septal ring-binding cell division protein DamX
VVINGVTRYNAVYGIYPDYQAANEAIDTLPAGIRDTKPWVRNLGILQQMLK